jgi:chromate transporter
MLRRILAGISCGAVGLLLAVVVKMLVPLVKRRDAAGLTVMVAVFVAIGLVRLPLQAVLLVAVPLSLSITFFARRRASA